MMPKPLVPLCCTAALLLVMVPPAISRAEDDAAIRVIRQQCLTIDNGAKRYTRKERDLSGESTEGGSLVGHYQSSRLRKMVASYYGESGRAVEEYYLVAGKPIFVLRTSIDYKAPLNSDQPGEGGIRATTKERFYFQDGHLIRWIGTDSKLKATTTPEAKSHEQDYKKQAARLVDMLARPPVAD